MQITMGIQTLAYPGPDLGELRDANALLGDPAALHQRMAEDGYLLLRGLIDREKVLAARARILNYLAEQEALVPGTPVLEGVMAPAARGVGMMGRKGVTREQPVLAALEAEELFNFFNGYFARPPLTFSYKWLRAVGHEKYTGAHYDVVYMGRGSANLHTAWIPVGDIPVEQGTLAICVGSHNEPGFERLRQTYGRMDVDRDLIEGWFSEDPLEITRKFGGQWRTTNFQAGDVIIFGMYTLHASTTNATDRYRLSCDVRFQPADEPVDERWVGENPTAHYRWGSPDLEHRTMADARSEWGV